MHAAGGAKERHACKLGSRALASCISSFRVLSATQNGASPLHLAAYKGRADVVKLLIGRGANFRVSSQQAFTTSGDHTLAFLLCTLVTPRGPAQRVRPASSGSVLACCFALF